MSVGSSVTAEELVRVLSRRQTTLPAEIGTFVVLEACESLLAHGPRDVAALDHVLISDSGTVVLSGAACDEPTAARSLRRAHAALLRAAGPGRSQPPHGAGVPDAASLRGLRDQLEAMLVPLNRDASRRVLARFARDVAQPVGPGDADSTLSSLLGVGAGPANDVAPDDDPTPIPEESSFQVDLFDGLNLDPDTFEHTPAPRESLRPSVQAVGAAPARSLRPSFAPRQAAPESVHSMRARADDLIEEESALPGSRKLFLGFSFVALAAAAVALAMSVRTPPVEPPAALSALDGAPTGAPRADLLVRASQPNAQVLMRVGAAPVEVPNLAVGGAHEFVATAAGFRPARVLIPAGASWETSPTGARYEVALQLEPAASPAEELALGPSRISDLPSAAEAELGSVRVVATPRGAQVYQLLGFASPVLRLRQLPLPDAQEILIYREGFRPEVRTLAHDDFKVQGGRRVAELDVTLVAADAP